MEKTRNIKHIGKESCDHVWLYKTISYNENINEKICMNCGRVEQFINQSDYDCYYEQWHGKQQVPFNKCTIELTRKDMDIITASLKQSIEKITINWVKEDVEKTLSNLKNIKR